MTLCGLFKRLSGRRERDQPLSRSSASHVVLLLCLGFLLCQNFDSILAINIAGAAPDGGDGNGIPK